MNLKKRLTWKFLSWLFILFIFFIFFGLLTQRMMIYKLEKEKNVNNISSEVIDTIVTSTTFNKNKIFISKKTLKAIQTEGYWIQILDSKGDEIYHFNRPVDIPTHYAPGEIIYYANNANITGYYFNTIYKNQKGNKFTWLIGKKMPTLGKYLSINSKEKLYFFFGIVISSFILVIVTAWLFGKRLGSPLLHIIYWIENLASGSYHEPANKYGKPISQKKNGQIKKRFRIYHEVVLALHQLTIILKKNIENQKKLEKTREEWMTGISHDLKTPLSSIIGYADILVSAKYTWTNEEKIEFAQIISDKAKYMEDLVQDFNLTFRLKNEALPLKRINNDVIEIVRRSVIDAANLPFTQNQQLNFISNQSILYYELDPNWFKRAIDNLIMNSIIHNPRDTTVNIEVKSNEMVNLDRSSPVFYIIIQDNGVGMTTSTQEHLFDRYYRGTNTEQSYSGTGLGMVIAKQLIQAHNGEIFIESELGKGTKITLSFF
ncbi:sensor histidine kinase [Lysinibacillus sp. NPDC094403]|uniref:sensor histidine kinase n=1 Tax=Lysinibacillus sp. NPDC094403 TaxID=3390581 RepID=UPI003CFE84FD